MVTPATHGGSVPLEPEALLADDPELRLAWAPLHELEDDEPLCPDCEQFENACTCEDESGS